MAGMESKFSFTRRGFFYNDITAVISPGENCAFGYMGQASGSPTYYFGAYESGATATYAGDWDGEAHTFVFEANYQVTSEDIRSFFTACKTYIVDVEHKLTNEKYDTMVDGVVNWMTTENITPYTAVMNFNNTGQGIPQFGNQGLDIEVMSGTKKLSDVGSLYGFENIEKVVHNIFINAYYYSQAGTSDYNDSPYEFLGYDCVRLAVESEYITDPDIIDFINDNTWDEVLETRCDWTINIDGVKNPNYTIGWTCPFVDSGDIDSGTATVTIKVKAFEAVTPIIPKWLTLGTFSYDQRFFDTTFNKLVETTGNPQWAYNLTNIFLDTTVDIQMYVTYFQIGVMRTTSIAQATLSYKGEGSGEILQPRDGSTITFTHTSTDEFKTEFLDDIDIPDTPDGTSPSSKQQTYSGIGVMTKTYVMTKSRLQQLGQFLWSYNFYDFIQNLNSSPIENVVSIKMLPFEIPAGTDTEIVLGNVETGVLGKPVDIDYNCKHVINPSGTTIAKKYGAKYNYLNSSPYTKLSLFLPYIGFKSLDPAIFLDHELKVEYIADIITGSCVAMIYADDVPITQFTGEIGLDIPISSTNRAQVEAGILQSVGQVALGASVGSAGGMVAGAMSILNNSYHTDTQGVASPCCNSFITHDVFYILDSPCVQIPSKYAHTHGLPLFLSKTLRNVHGFTVCENVDTSGISGATQEEKEMIKEALESGVYL